MTSLPQTDAPKNNPHPCEGCRRLVLAAVDIEGRRVLVESTDGDGDVSLTASLLAGEPLLATVQDTIRTHYRLHRCPTEIRSFSSMNGRKRRDPPEYFLSAIGRSAATRRRGRR
jgi:hypothetical protein